MQRSVFVRTLLIACLLRYTAATQHVSMYVHERRSSIPKIFVEDGPAPEDRILDLRISLLANDPEGLEKALYAISTPGNPAYRQHLSKAKLYGLPAKSAMQSSNGIAVAGFINQWANAADLQLFLKQYRSDVDSSTGFSSVFLDGGSNSQDLNSAGMEAGVDIQWTIGLASGVPVTFYSVGEDSNNGGIDGWIDLVNYLLSQDHPPQVLTTSCSFDESDVPIDVASSLCNLYAQLGARGTSVIFSSGDGGVAGGSNKTCTSFVPTFPSTCPYVTSVGATSSLAPEVAAQHSSGGFSNYFATPFYQTSAASTFLKQLDGAYNGIFNGSGRGFPDVSAQGANMAFVYRQQQKLGGGTSFAAPVFASTVALLNAELAAAGKAPLGFLNPLIYSSTGAFTDIVQGSNPGCGTGGFSAMSGWDPVSGIGTPVYSALRSAVSLS
ncbi:hypothetical protein EWM64_g3115 [Hericium alpestre]|uniref:tripeptidyl-peptidase II n=1 Tax=Hericium alpestre TaxID=135208 RepID=A0A4Z0A3J2_9AGAM|nr:hypothetical protein EWM64_g3115 [Hericium alpestre]